MFYYFQTFSIASPFEPASGALDGTGLASAATQTAAVGHCTTDMFTATGAPVICGLNTGQHSKLCCFDEHFIKLPL